MMSGGSNLSRYHSAPTSVLLGLLDDDFSLDADDSEMSRLLNDGIGSFASLLDTSTSTTNTKPQQQQQQHRVQPTIPPHPGPRRSLFPNPPPPFPNPNPNPSPSHASASPPPSDKPDPLSCFPPLPSLTRRTSSPAHLLSKLALDEMTHGSIPTPVIPYDDKASVRRYVASQMPSPSTSSVTTPPKRHSYPPPQNDDAADALIRQSSSPASLLSQVAMEEMSVTRGDKGVVCLPPLPSSSSPPTPAESMLFDRRGHSSASWMGEWDDYTALSHRKRGRVPQEMMLSNVAQSPENLNSSPQLEGFSPPTHADDLESSIVCRVRAKRGHATHPRSIAERVRRTKISERIKKLQDLVPNLHKQANTADMLDEIVEYVKLLQRQIQELSLNHPVCNCRHQQYGNMSA